MVLTSVIKQKQTLGSFQVNFHMRDWLNLQALTERCDAVLHGGEDTKSYKSKYIQIVYHATLFYHRHHNRHEILFTIFCFSLLFVFSFVTHLHKLWVIFYYFSFTGKAKTNIVMALAIFHNMFGCVGVRVLIYGCLFLTDWICELGFLSVI